MKKKEDLRSADYVKKEQKAGAQLAQMNSFFDGLPRKLRRKLRGKEGIAKMMKRAGEDDARLR